MGQGRASRRPRRARQELADDKIAEALTLAVKAERTQALSAIKQTIVEKARRGIPDKLREIVSVIEDIEYNDRDRVSRPCPGDRPSACSAPCATARRWAGAATSQAPAVHAPDAGAGRPDDTAEHASDSYRCLR